MSKKQHLILYNTFEHFIGKESNPVLFSMRKLITHKQDMNLFYLYGESGVGKTHYGQAVVQEALSLGKKALYIRAEDMALDYSSHLRKQDMVRFRSKYNKLDILVIDELEYLWSKEYTLSEFYYLVSKRNEKGKITIFLSKKYLGKSTFFFDVRNLLISSVTVQVNRLNKEEKEVFIRERSSFYNLTLSEDSIDYLVKEFSPNLHHLDGFFKTLVVYNESNMKTITIDKKMLKVIYDKAVMK